MEKDKLSKDTVNCIISIYNILTSIANDNPEDAPKKYRLRHYFNPNMLNETERDLWEYFSSQVNAPPGYERWKRSISLKHCGVNQSDLYDTIKVLRTLHMTTLEEVLVKLSADRRPVIEAILLERGLNIHTINCLYLAADMLAHIVRNNKPENAPLSYRIRRYFHKTHITYETLKEQGFTDENIKILTTAMHKEITNMTFIELEKRLLEKKNHKQKYPLPNYLFEMVSPFAEEGTNAIYEMVEWYRVLKLIK